MTTDARFRDTLKSAMCLRPLKSDSITAASIYHAVDREHPTLLIDEADNLGLAFNGPLRAVLNSGHRRGGKVTRYHGGHARSFSTFSPVAVAAIGSSRACCDATTKVPDLMENSVPARPVYVQRGKPHIGT
jgi:hypothetical protein